MMPEHKQIIYRLECCLLLFDKPEAAVKYLSEFEQEHGVVIAENLHLKIRFLGTSRMVALNAGDIPRALRNTEELFQLVDSGEVPDYAIGLAAIDYVKVHRWLRSDKQQVLARLEQFKIYPERMTCEGSELLIKTIADWDE